MSTIFADAWLITMNDRREVLENASVCVRKDRIATVGTRKDVERRSLIAGAYGPPTSTPKLFSPSGHKYH